MITKEELERIKQGDGLVIESNGIKCYHWRRTVQRGRNRSLP